jgi:DNA-binding NarL/FixJ family response regulator
MAGHTPPSSSYREGLPLTPRDLRIAALFANGLKSNTIAVQVDVSQKLVDVTVMRVYERMSASLNLPLTTLRRRDMHDWLSERGLLPVEGD